MTITYELRVHGRDVFTSTGFDRHSGYDLITTNENGAKTIQYIDLYNDNGKIKYYISEPISAIEYTLIDTGIIGETTSTNIVWGLQTFHDKQVNQQFNGITINHRLKPVKTRIR